MTKRPRELLQYYGVHEPATDKMCFQWRSRLLQSLWREQRSLRKGTLYGKPHGKLRGACLAMPEAQQTLSNFLTPDIRKVVCRELQNNSKRKGNAKKLYGIPRIYNHLLSSQPLCFNLFGELTLDLDLATRVFAEMTKGRIAQVRSICFEFSPGRRDCHYTGDNSAFDVYATYKTGSGGKGFVSIEVKYHEIIKAGEERKYYENHGKRYEEIAFGMACFNEAELGRVRGLWLQQIWRDHLLMHAHKIKDEFDDAIFVFLHPKANSSCCEAVEEYRNCFKNDTNSFLSWTLECFVKCLMDHSSADWIRQFHQRYLDFSPVDDLLASKEWA